MKNNGDDMTEQKFKERYSRFHANRYHDIDPRTVSHQRAIFRAAAKLLVNGFAGEPVPLDAEVGYLIDEGGWLFSQKLGTIKDVIQREAEQYNDVDYHRDDVYMDVVHYVPKSMEYNEAYPDIVDGGYYALITIQR